MSDFDDGYDDAKYGSSTLREYTSYSYACGVEQYERKQQQKKEEEARRNSEWEDDDDCYYGSSSYQPSNTSLFDPFGIFDGPKEKTSSDADDKLKNYSEVVDDVMKWSKTKYEKFFHNKYPTLKLVVAVLNYIIANILAILYKIFYFVTIIIVFGLTLLGNIIAIVPLLLEICFYGLIIIGAIAFICALFGI